MWDFQTWAALAAPTRVITASKENRILNEEVGFAELLVILVGK